LHIQQLPKRFSNPPHGSGVGSDPSTKALPFLLRRATREALIGYSLSRKDLNHPPTAVGGISANPFKSFCELHRFRIWSFVESGHRFAVAAEAALGVNELTKG